MSFPDAVKICFSKYVDFNGRARRSEFWWWVLFTVPARDRGQHHRRRAGHPERLRIGPDPEHRQPRGAAAVAGGRRSPTARHRAVPAGGSCCGRICIVGWIFLIIWYVPGQPSRQQVRRLAEVAAHGRRTLRSAVRPTGLRSAAGRSVRPASGRARYGQPPATATAPAVPTPARERARCAARCGRTAPAPPVESALASELAAPLVAAAPPRLRRVECLAARERARFAARCGRTAPASPGRCVLTRARPPASTPRPGRVGRPRPAAGATRAAGSPERR